MRHEGSKRESFLSLCQSFFFDEQHMRALFCVKRAAAMNVHTRHFKRHTHTHRYTHHWFNKHGRHCTFGLQNWPWSCDILQHNQYNLRHTVTHTHTHREGRRKERREGRGGGKRCTPSPVFPLSRLASVFLQEPVVRRGSIYDQGLREEHLQINWMGDTDRNK